MICFNCETMAPLLVVAILCSLTSILVIKSSYAHNGYIFSGDRRSSSLVGSVEREENSPRVIYSITFSKNSVAPLGNLKVVLDKLLRFHIQGSAFFFFFWRCQCWGQTCWLDVLSPFLAVPSTSLEVSRTWVDQVRPQSCPCWGPGTSWGSFPLNFPVILWFVP